MTSLKSFVFVGAFFLANNLMAQSWLERYNESLEYFNLQQFEESLAAGEDALTRYKRESDVDHPNYRAILRQLSVTAYMLNDMSKASRYAQVEVDSWKSASNVDENAYIDALDNLGVMQTYTEDFDNAITNLNEALQLVKVTSIKSDAEQALIEGHLAQAYFARGDLEASKEHFQSALGVLDQVDEIQDDYLNFTYSYGTLLVETKEYALATKYLTSLFQWFAEDEPDPLVVNANLGLGTAFTYSNELAAGEKHYLLALRAIEAEPDYYGISLFEIKQKLAYNYEQQGRSEEAQALLAEISSSVLGENGSVLEQAMFLNSQATSSLNVGKVNEALGAYSQALELLKTNGQEASPEYGIILLNTIKANEQADNLVVAAQLSEDGLSMAGADSALRYQLLAEYAGIMQKQGQFDVATQSFNEVIAADRSTWSPTLKAQILNKAASFYQVRGDFTLSSELYIEALSIDGIVSNKGLYQSILFNYVTLLQAQGKIDEAETLLVDLKSSIGSDNSEVYLGLLRNMGAMAQTKGDFNTAASRYNEALELAKEVGGESSPAYADILLRMATLDKDLGNYQEAEPKFLEVSEIIAEVQGVQHPNYASVANNMGILYQQMGNYDKAEEKFKVAIEIYKNAFGEDNPDYVMSLENLATLYELIGDEEQALELLAITLEVNKQIYGEENPNYAISLHNYASLLQKTDRKDEAFTMLEQVLALQAGSMGVMQPGYANSLHNLAILAQEQEKYDLADSLLEEVLRIRGTLFDLNHPSYTSSLYSKAVLQQVTNKYDEAWITYNQVIEQYLNQIRKYFPSLSEVEKNAFYAKLAPVVNRYKEFCIEYYINYKQDPEVLKRLYNVQLATKALLLNAVNKTREQILNSNNEILIAEFNAWTNLKKQLVNYYSYSKEQLTAEGINIPALEEEANTLEKSLSRQSSAFADEFEKVEITWQSVATSLQAEEMAIELMRIERNGVEDSVTYAGLVIHETSSAPELATMPFGTAMETRFYNFYKNTVKFQVHDKRSYEVFWRPINDLIAGASTIYISADGVYNKVNINTIFNINTENYLIEDYFVKYISSTKDLLNRPSPSEANLQSMLCMGDPAYDLQGDPNVPAELNEVQRSHLNMNRISPLPGTKKEIEFIDSLLAFNSWNVNAYMGQAALEKQLKDEKSVQVIHLATHGFFMPDLKLTELESQVGVNEYDRNPLFRSGLLFAGASNIHEGVENDGVLTAYEAMNLYLDDTKLVVLSACETALGDVKNGEGVYGLQRALVVAGAQNLIMSLWKVNDEATMQLMKLFYTNWTGGEDIYQSLQKAQIQMMKENEEPYYWGGFIMIGI